MTLVVVDASVLVAELLRPRGRRLLRSPDLSVLVADEQWDETRYEIRRRLEIVASRARFDAERRAELEGEVQDIVDDDVLAVVPRDDYSHLRAIALRRVPRDERDWPTVAVALATGAAILTADHDFLGCGCPTWTVETLMAELQSG